MRDWTRARFEQASPALRFLFCAAVLKLLCSGFYLSLFTNGSDFGLFHGAAAAVWQGRGGEIYDKLLATTPDNPDTLYYIYPGPVAALYAPLGALPFRPALTIFELLMLGCIIGSVYLWLRHKELSPPADGFYLAAAAVLLFFPLDYSLQLGQCEALVLLSLVGFLAAREKRPALAGFALALAVTLKLFLGVAVLYLLFKRRWKLFGWAAGWFAALQAASLPFVPWASQARYYAKLAGPLGIESFYDNQSLTGLVSRTFTDSPYTRGVVDAPGFARAAATLCGLLLLGALAALALKDGDEKFEEGFALSLIAAPLISPHSDTHHQTVLLIAFLLLLGRKKVKTATLLFYGFFAAFAPIVAFKFTAQEQLVVFAGGWPALIYSLPTVAMLAFFRHAARELREAA